MSKNSRTREESSSNYAQINKKRKCGGSSNRTLIEPSESVLWPETEDSFFTDAKIDKLLAANKSPAPNKNHKFFEDNADDSLFSDIVLPHESESGEGNVGATPLVQVLPSTDSENGIVGDDTLFSEINIDQLLAGGSTKPDAIIVPNEEGGNLFNDDRFINDGNGPKQESKICKTLDEDMFKDDFPTEDLLQCTQKFLDDVAFKVPKPRNVKQTQIMEHTRANVDTCIQGTQYETREEIKNRTINPLNETRVIRETENLSRFNWETQIFTKDVVEDYPCKGEFYGLPDRVKRMIFESKGIKSLYGE